MEMHFASVWENISDHIPDEPALICDDNIKTWKEYEERAARLAYFLNEKNISNNSKQGFISIILMSILKLNSQSLR